MSFSELKTVRTRLNRSELFVPGSKPELFEKAVSSNADVICIDLEDAVAPQDKDQAKKNIISALNDFDFGKKTISIRLMVLIQLIVIEMLSMLWKILAKGLI